MDDEKLILLVQENECIYNKFNANYKNIDKKKMAWLEISEQMGVKGNYTNFFAAIEYLMQFIRRGFV